MAARALTPSTTAFIVSLLLFTTLLSSADDACPHPSCVVESLCKATTGETGRTQISKVCCKLLEPLNFFGATACICKGNPDSNLQDVMGILGYSCDLPFIPLIYISCGPIETAKLGKIRSVTN